MATPAFQLPLQLHRNQRLFSDYYLAELLPQRPEWQRLAEDARPVMDRIASIFERYTPSPGEKEAQTEKEWVQPVLEALGHVFEVQPSLKVPGAAQEPDYVFYWNQTARQANKGKVLDERLLASVAYAIGDAKHWDRPLDVALRQKGADPFTNKNPSYQIAFYVQHSGLEWGILTNGRLWRLYHRDTAHKLDRLSSTGRFGGHHRPSASGRSRPRPGSAAA